jgi:hypothetical protein
MEPSAIAPTQYLMQTSNFEPVAGPEDCRWVAARISIGKRSGHTSSPAGHSLRCSMFDVQCWMFDVRI